MSEKKQHWENVYHTKDDNEVSWYQETPITSLNTILKLKIDASATIIDVGGGNSNLTRDLLGNNFTNISVLDISKKALRRTQKKLGENGENVNWIASDILDFETEYQFEIWHDRATFHFLTESNDIAKYVEIVSNAIKKNGHLVLATFSTSGPKKCSGLDIKQYDKETLIAIFKDNFILVESFEEIHETPFETEQNFIYTVLKKR